jgi:hypothetical protein
LTTYLARFSPCLISISLFKCIINEDKNLAITITNVFPGLMLNGGFYS